MTIAFHALAMSLVAMVLAAGFGTRLRPLTEELPKPLVPIGDRSVLAHVTELLRLADIKRLVINTHHLPERFDEAALAALSLPTQVVHEPKILGTAGGVAGAHEALGGGSVLVYNGDVLVDLDVVRLLSAHRQRQPLATLALVGGLAAGEGTVGLDGCGRVVRLRDGRYGEEVSGADFAGVQVLSPAIRERLPAEGCLVGDVYMPALAEGGLLLGAEVAAGFTDIGTPAAYLAANLAWLARSGQSSFCGVGAQVTCDVQLEQVVVGAGARIDGQGLVARCVLWSEARVTAPLEDCVVTSSGRIVAAGQH